MAQLKITYDKRFNAFDGYLMGTEVDTVNTEPDIIQKCLVIQKASGGVAETLLRVAGAAELETLSELPANISVFSSSVLDDAGVLVGDVIQIENLPAIWDIYFPESAVGDQYTVTDNSNVAFGEVTVTPAFPYPDKEIEFSVWRSGTQIYPVGVAANPDDGAADRDYSAVPGETEFLTGEHYDQYANYDAANNRFKALESQAQSLVDALNQDSYTEIYVGEYA
jgi:hypothetical protein